MRRQAAHNHAQRRSMLLHSPEIQMDAPRASHSSANCRRQWCTRTSEHASRRVRNCTDQRAGRNMSIKTLRDSPVSPWQMWTLKRPFSHLSDHQVMSMLRKLKTGARSELKLLEQVPLHVREGLQHCLCINPQARPTAQTLMERFQLLQ